MQVVILAGGLGTRLRPITRLVPKPMVPVAGVPYLEHQLRLLARQSLTNVLILTGYLGEQIEARFGDGHEFGLRIRYCRERIPMGTGGALRDARWALAERFLVIYGDSYLPIPYSALADQLEANGAGAVLAVYRDASHETNVPPNIALGPDGAVLRYDKRARCDDSEMNYIDAGVLALRRTVLDLIPEEGAASLEEKIFPALIGQRRLFAHLTNQRFYDMGTPERLRAIEEYLA